MARRWQSVDRKESLVPQHAVRTDWGDVLTHLCTGYLQVLPAQQWAACWFITGQGGSQHADSSLDKEAVSTVTNHRFTRDSLVMEHGIISSLPQDGRWIRRRLLLLD